MSEQSNYVLLKSEYMKEEPDVNKIKYLIENGISKENIDNFFNGGCLMHYAIINNHLEIIEMLYNLGADMTVNNVFDENLLMFAYLYANKETLIFLCDLGLDVTEESHNDNTVFIIAAKFKDYDTLKKLIKYV